MQWEARVPASRLAASGWSPAPLVVKADFRYDGYFIKGAGTAHFVWLPFWCRAASYDPDAYACYSQLRFD